MGFMAFGGKFIGFESRSHTFCEARCMTTQGTFGFISASSFAGFVPSSVGCLRRSSKDRSRVLPKFSTATLDMLLLQLGWWLQLLRENISWTSSSSQSYGCKMVVNQEYVKPPTWKCPFLEGFQPLHVVLSIVTWEGLEGMVPWPTARRFFCHWPELSMYNCVYIYIIMGFSNIFHF